MLNKPSINIPRRAIPVTWGVIVSFIQVILPWLISRMDVNHGWIGSTPGLWNLLGLLFIASGIAAYILCLVFHFKTYTGPVRAGMTPPKLVTNGPYQYSRNPMYVSALFAWCGWTLFLGSIPVMIALVLLGLTFVLYVVPKEEKQLEGLFGDNYLTYKRAVPRWLGGTINRS